MDIKAASVPEWTERSIVVDPDIDVLNKEPNTVLAYIETWFDVDKKFGTNTGNEDNTWINLYAIYNADKDELKMTYSICAPDGGSEHEYIPTTNEKALVVRLLRECCEKAHGQTLEEYIASVEI